MGYGIEEWKSRIAQRSDFTTSLVHLTRDAATDSALDVLIKILSDKKLVGSTTASGFIVGSTPAVCLQESPIYSLAQNIYTEQSYRKQNPSAKKRYLGVGLQFAKAEVFLKGGRPVIYERTATAKAFLPPDEWWRIVNFDLTTSSAIVDWSHEREWRVPNELSFELNQVAVLLPNSKTYHRFVKRCLAMSRPDFLTDTRGIVQLSSVFY
ncbi:TPA: hypothetical protein QEL58_000921 [Stenotrophomonas maltophilia]|nr:hypothetical protein [Stenotrophomonas maltophilia]